jgi:hypothetical protein
MILATVTRRYCGLHPATPAASGFLAILPLALWLGGPGGVLLYGGLLAFVVSLTVTIIGLAVLTERLAGR